MPYASRGRGIFPAAAEGSGKLGRRSHRLDFFSKEYHELLIYFLQPPHFDIKVVGRDQTNTIWKDLKNYASRYCEVVQRSKGLRIYHG
ncbi:hypothetical protein SBDP1_480032 [Syntrophobacter sp. SbD1]|nr:hypothetical protein SBDP1_480032 [Syntrophobacter sp. SbD1]